MSKLAHVVHQLKKERKARRRIQQLDDALKALTSISAARGTAARHDRAQAWGGKRRTMSAAARKRIAAARRTRWATEPVRSWQRDSIS